MKCNARFILSRKALLAQYNLVKELADEVSYSVKTNPVVAVVLQELTGAGFSVHSTEYLKLINDPSKVWFFAQAWSIAEIKELFERGVNSFVVDNENDLKTLLSFLDMHPDAEINLLLRMRAKEHTIKTGKHFVLGMYSSTVNKWLGILHDKGQIKKLGVHIHRKTQNISEWSLKEEISSISEENLRRISIVNIGGGFPVKYRNSRPSMAPIIGRVKELRSWLNSRGITMIIEPGRMIAAPAVKLEANIVNIYEGSIIVDCSVYNAAMDTFVADIRLEVEGELSENDEGAKPYTIKGCTPDSMDIIRYRVFLRNPEIGGKIYFINAGAYTYSTDFCGLKKLETVITD